MAFSVDHDCYRFQTERDEGLSQGVVEYTDKDM